MATILEFAKSYLKRGWKPIPVPSGRKGPIIDGWTDIRLTPETAPQHFDGMPSNIGILTGEPSGWLIDVDLDTPEAVALAEKYLPPTMRFGRDSKPASHWLYCCPGMQPKAFPLPPAEAGGRPRTVCEIRSTRQQTMFPPSVHPCGEAVRWEQGTPALPTKIAPAELAAAVLALATAAAKAMPDADALGEAIAEWTRPAQPPKSLREPTDIDTAADSYNCAHAEEWPKSGGDCPVCGHKGCFGRFRDDPLRWVCYSTGHGDVGLRGRNCTHGDALDLAAYRAGVDRVALLRREGYLSKRSEPDKDRNLIRIVSGEAPAAIDATIPALVGSGRLFRRSQRLVSVVDWVPPKGEATITRQTGSPVIAEVSSGALWDMAGRVADWERYDVRDKAWRKCDAPTKVISTIHALGEWPTVPALRGLVTIPIMREDGSLCCTPGYDAKSGLYYAPTSQPPDVIDKPTQADAEYAAKQLLEVVEDFPFTDTAHRSAWLATVLARVGWGAFVGGAPMTVLDATTPGTGKTLAADMSALISTGAVAAHSPYVEDDDELRKRITSHLMAGDQVILIDNAPGGSRIGWPSLDAALTSETWQDRELGKNAVARVPMDALWMVTGNNLEIGADAARRTLRCRLESPDERPEERTGFRHPDLPAWVRKERRRLLGAAFTILRGYIVAGRPGMSLVPMGSFEGWSGLVRAAIVWAGQLDPCGARVTTDDGADADAEAHKSLMDGWGLLLDAGHTGLTTSQILGQIKGSPEVFEPMAEAIAHLCGTTDATAPTPKSLGKALAKLKGRVRTVGGKPMRIVCHRSGERALRWSVRSVRAVSVPPFARELAISNMVSANVQATEGAKTDETTQTDAPGCDDDNDDEVPF